MGAGRATMAGGATTADGRGASPRDRAARLRGDAGQAEEPDRNGTSAGEGAGHVLDDR